ncbi:hypothetical protein P5V15_005097 [Pogonomyrmex californicus]
MFYARPHIGAVRRIANKTSGDSARARARMISAPPVPPLRDRETTGGPYRSIYAPGSKFGRARARVRHLSGGQADRGDLEERRGDSGVAIPYHAPVSCTLCLEPR